MTCSCHSENLLSFLVALSSIINNITMTSDLILCAAHKSKYLKTVIYLLYTIFLKTV